MRRAIAGIVCALLLAACPPVGVAVADEAEDANAARVERFRAASAAHPDDADLAWAHARALADAGRDAEAAARLQAFESRWPAQRLDAPLELARLRLALGGLRRRPRRRRARHPEPARVGLGALLPRAGGCAGTARSPWPTRRSSWPRVSRRTSRPRPCSCAPSTTWTRARTRWPRCCCVARSRSIPPRRPRGACACCCRGATSSTSAAGGSSAPTAGVEWDSNVTLDSGSEALGLPRDQREWRWAWGAAATFRPIRKERGGLTLGYRYDQVEHDDLDDYDFVSNSGFLSASYRPWTRVLTRLDVIGWGTRRDGGPYFRSGVVRPNVFIELGQWMGTTRFFGEVEWRDYEDAPLLTPLDRNALVYGAGFEHFLPFFRPGAWLSVGGSFDRVDTEAVDVLNFAGDYDRDEWEVGLRAYLPLFWKIDADASFEFGYDDYANDNLIAFSTQDGELIERLDKRGELRIALIRPVVRFVQLEISWRGVLQSSNVDAFDYDRQIFGAYVRVASE